MKLSVYISVICVSLLSMSFGVHAQTPTPHPNALQPGMYQFEDLSAPQIALTGVDWTICRPGGGLSPEGLCNDDPGETLTFYVEGVDYLTFQAYFYSSATGQFSLCVEGVCTSHNHRIGSTGFLGQFAFDVGGNAEIVYATENNASNFLDYIQLYPLPIDLSSISGTGGSSPTPTPEPYYIYGSISGTSGDVDTRFDMIITVGDVAVSSALLFLLFSLWAFIFLVVIPRRDNVGE